MTRVRIVVPLVAFCTVLAVLMLGRPTTFPTNVGPVPASAATPLILFDASACQGTVKVGSVFETFASAGQIKANETVFTFQGTETDTENGSPVTFSFSGTYGPGPGPGATTTFTANQTACTSCTSGPCAGLAGCKVLAGHPELAKRVSVGVVETSGNAVFVYEPAKGGSPALTAACNSYPSTGK